MLVCRKQCLYLWCMETTDSHLGPIVACDIADIGIILRKMREAAGMSRDKLAAKMHCSPKTIDNVEKKRTIPRPSILACWQTHCGAKITCSALLPGSPSALPPSRVVFHTLAAERNPLDAAYELLRSGIPHGTVLRLNHSDIFYDQDHAMHNMNATSLRDALFRLDYPFGSEFAVDHVNATLRHIPAIDKP